MFESNALVEEFMLLANVTVSKRILRNFPTLSVLRRHPAPNRSMFDSLISKAKCRGVTINIDDSKKLADSLDAAIVKDDPYFNKLLRILSTRCMSPAQYFCSGEYKPSEWHHYGLATHVYTHFTSPIRRYADVCVHRLLAAAIGVEPLPNHLSSKSYLHELAANMNRRHRAAQLAGRASVQLHTLLVFSENVDDREDDAYVLDVDCNPHNEPSLTVIIPRYGVEGRVYLRNVQYNDPLFKREPELHRISYRESVSGSAVSSIQVFDKITVKIRVEVVQENHKELVIDLLKPSFGSNNDRMQDSVSLKRKRRTS
jgi:exosome complex exonuclease DIS3/RRP44